MIRSVSAGLVLILMAACSEAPQHVLDQVSPSEIADDELISAYAFLTDETRALQDDAFANPGYLWVDRGEALFTSAPAEGGASCASCHAGDSLSGVAARYPRYHAETETVVNLEGQINQCRVGQQGQAALVYESEELLALTTYIAIQSNGQPIEVYRTDGDDAVYSRGEDYFFTRRGQLNLACSQCHNENWGQKLRGDTISQGHGNGFPAYRFEWQGLGSLHRRFEDCDLGVRAEPYALGSATYLELEYYLAIRAAGLPLESPAVRR